ncbi:MAG TPA: ATP-binding cassette domain-containing protein [Mycobacteriales bacterium]|nr:ATP-binding cassette domain-containing protein [Mycobacteriales bacterium]
MSTPFQLTGGRAGYARRRVLDDVDFSVGHGEFVTVLGANGSGKTTLLRTLLRLNRLDAGELLLFGEPAARFRGWRRIGYVPQRPASPGGVPASVEEVVLSGRVAASRPWRAWSTADRAAAAAALAAVGMSDSVGSPVDALSGGQHQRVLIARALAGSPDVLVMDEPNAGIDADSQDALTNALGDLKAAGTAVVLVAHELGSLVELVDRVVILAHGSVAYDGTEIPAELHDDTHHHMHHRDVADRRPWGLT